MGATGSIAVEIEAAPSEIEEFRGSKDCHIDFHIQTEFEGKLDLIGVAVGTRRDASLLASSSEVVKIWGHSYRLGVLSTPEEDLGNLDITKDYTKDMRLAVLDLLESADLLTSYDESYAYPVNRDPTSLYISLSCSLHLSDNNFAVTTINGCIPHSKLSNSLTDDDSNYDLMYGSWMAQLGNILAGDKYKDSRHSIRQWWGKVERSVTVAGKTGEIKDTRKRLEEVAKKHTLAYLRLINAGLISSDADKLTRDVHACRKDVLDASTALASLLLDNLFSQVDTLLMEILKDKSGPAIARLLELKQKLLHQYEVEVVELADSLELEENNARKEFEKRFSKQHHDAVAAATTTSSATVPSMTASTPMLPPSGRNGKTSRPNSKSSSRPNSASSSTTPRPKSPAPGTRLESIQSGKILDDPPASAPQAANAHNTKHGFDVMSTLTTAAKNSSKARLEQHLSLKRRHAEKQQDLSHRVHAVAAYELAMFEEAVMAQFNDTMHREQELLESYLFSYTSKTMDQLSIKVAKENARAASSAADKITEAPSTAISEVSGEDDLEESMEIPATTSMEHLSKVQEARRNKLEYKIAEKKRLKREKFEAQRAVQEEQIKKKLDMLRVRHQKALLSPAAINKYQALFQIIQMMLTTVE